MIINISQMQQTIREAVDRSAEFSTTLKGGVYQRLLNSLDDIRQSLGDIGDSLSKEEAFASRLKLWAQNAALQAAIQQDVDKSNNLEKETASLG